MEKNSRIMNKKGVLGLDTVQAVIVVLLVLAVVAIATFVALTSLVGPTGAVSDTKQSSNQALTNETITLNSTGDIPTTVSGNRIPITYTNLIVTNETGGEVIQSGNFTTTSGGFFLSASGAAGDYNETEINVSGIFTFTTDSDSQNLVSNVTTGTADFFDNIPTIMTILGAVIIILAVVLIILAVGRIRAGSKEAGL